MFSKKTNSLGNDWPIAQSPSKRVCVLRWQLLVPHHNVTGLSKRHIVLLCPSHAHITVSLRIHHNFKVLWQCHRTPQKKPSTETRLEHLLLRNALSCLRRSIVHSSVGRMWSHKKKLVCPCCSRVSHSARQMSQRPRCKMSDILSHRCAHCLNSSKLSFLSVLHLCQSMMFFTFFSRFVFFFHSFLFL